MPCLRCRKHTKLNSIHVFSTHHTQSCCADNWQSVSCKPHCAHAAHQHACPTHTRTVVSKEPEMALAPSGVTATLYTAPVWPPNVATHVSLRPRVYSSHTYTCVTAATYGSTVSSMTAMQVLSRLILHGIPCCSPRAMRSLGLLSMAASGTVQVQVPCIACDSPPAPFVCN